jgi:hypothetical protein
MKRDTVLGVKDLKQRSLLDKVLEIIKIKIIKFTVENLN